MIINPNYLSAVSIRIFMLSVDLKAQVSEVKGARALRLPQICYKVLIPLIKVLELWAFSVHFQGIKYMVYLPGVPKPMA